TKTGYANAQLGALYGLAVDGEELGAITHPETRRGILTTAAVLAAHAPPHRTSPTKRGAFIRSAMLCLSVPPPPDGVEEELNPDAEASPDPEEEAATIRELLDRHRSDAECASCHALFDPMGFPLENFDGIGRFRTE